MEVLPFCIEGTSRWCEDQYPDGFRLARQTG
jgi:hypothetical protein